MDVGRLLIEARAVAGMSQRDLARASGTQQSLLCRYETGLSSPTAKVLNRLLAGAGLQARLTLEPLLAHLDERVDALMAAKPSVDVDRLLGAADTLHVAEGEPVSWAFDGATALNLHGLGMDEGEVIWLVLVFDEPARRWMSRRMVKGMQGRGTVGWNSVDLERARDVLGTLALAPFGLARLRLVEKLPATVELVLPSNDRVRVTTVDEVEQAFPAQAELLQRWRARRTLEG